MKVGTDRNDETVVTAGDVVISNDIFSLGRAQQLLQPTFNLFSQHPQSPSQSAQFRTGLVLEPATFVQAAVQSVLKFRKREQPLWQVFEALIATDLATEEN